MATIISVTPQPVRKLECVMCGARYSADPRDYFWAPAGYAFTCYHGEEDDEGDPAGEGETFPCALIQRVSVAIAEDDGATLYTSGYRVIAEVAHIEDLPDPT